MNQTGTMTKVDTVVFRTSVHLPGQHTPMQKIQTDDNIKLYFDAAMRCILIEYKNEQPERAPLENVVQFSELPEEMTTQAFKAAKQK